MSEQTPQSVAPETSVPSEVVESQVEGSEGDLGLDSGEVSASDVADLKDVLNDPTATKQEKAQAKKMLKEFDIVVDGKKYRETLPFEVEDSEEIRSYLVKQAQMARVSNKRMQEKSQIEKDAKELIEMLRTNPRAVLSDPAIGVDFKQIAAQFIEEELANAQKSPEQIELEAARAELKAEKERRAKEETSRQERERERMQEEAFNNYSAQLTSALKTHSMPSDPIVIQKMANYMQIALSKGIELTMEEIAPIVKEEVNEDIRRYAKLLSAEDLEEFVGKEAISQIRKKNLAKAQTPASVKSAIKDTGKSSKDVAPEAPKQSFKKFFGV